MEQALIGALNLVSRNLPLPPDLFSTISSIYNGSDHKPLLLDSSGNYTQEDLLAELHDALLKQRPNCASGVKFNKTLESRYQTQIQRRLTELEASRVAEEEEKQRNDGVQAWHGRQRQRASRAEKLRFQALKADDQEAYMRMVKESKNERLTLLLEETNKLLVNLGAAVQRQKDSKQSDGIEPLEDSEPGLPQSDALKSGISKESRLEEDVDLIDSDHNGDSSDLLEGQRQYNSAIHSIQEKGVTGPHLIVAPKAVLPNWMHEFSTWVPRASIEESRVCSSKNPGLGNSLQELWSLLNFLLPNIFNSVQNFEDWFNAPFADRVDVSLTDEEQLLIIRTSSSSNKAFILRRKKDEGRKISSWEISGSILKCDMSAWQKVYYHQVTDVGRVGLDNGSGQSKSLQNLTMQLRKCCNHPYLFVGDYDMYKRKEEIVRASGKFELLDRLLQKLRRADLMALQKLRKEGSLLRKFNAPDSPYFMFLLSTRAGAQDRREMLEEIMRRGTSSLGTDVPRRLKENYRSRLMEEHELPDWVYSALNKDDKVKFFDSGSVTGKRKRKEVVYADTLSDLQWMKAVENGHDISKLSVKGKRRYHLPVDSHAQASDDLGTEERLLELRNGSVPMANERSSEDTFNVTPASKRLKHEQINTQKHENEDVGVSSLNEHMFSWNTHRKKRSNYLGQGSLSDTRGQNANGKANWN
ncbi:SNF2-related, N-terminal domain [Sesbania bispinosa]|nr:SNF2-related, N-terminal domain [Sesbania bispinosa]